MCDSHAGPEGLTAKSFGPLLDQGHGRSEEPAQYISKTESFLSATAVKDGIATPQLSRVVVDIVSGLGYEMASHDVGCFDQLKYVERRFLKCSFTMTFPPTNGI